MRIDETTDDDRVVAKENGSRGGGRERLCTREYARDKRNDTQNFQGDILHDGRRCQWIYCIRRLLH